MDKLGKATSYSLEGTFIIKVKTDITDTTIPSVETLEYLLSQDLNSINSSIEIVGFKEFNLKNITK